MRRFAWPIVALVAGFLASPACAWAGGVTPIGQLVAPGSGEALSSGAVSGSTVFSGAPASTFTAQDQGAVFAYNEPAGGWTGSPSPSAVLVSSDPQSSGGLGSTVLASGSLVVASGDGSGEEIDVFTEPAGGWSGIVLSAARLTASNGALLSSPVVSGSEIVAIGEKISGPRTDEDVQSDLYVFTEPAGGWSGTIHQSAILVTSGDNSFSNSGQSVAISGTTIFGGDMYDDAVYVYTEPVDGWAGTVAPTAELTGSDDATQNIGWSVVAAGNTVVTGGDSVVVPAVSADVFVEPAGGWASETPTGTLNATNSAYPTEIGVASFPAPQMAISGSTIVLPAAARNASNGDEIEVLDVYNEPNGGWSGTESQTATLAASDGNSLVSAQFVGSTLVANALSADSSETVGDTSYPLYLFQEPVTGFTGNISESAELTEPSNLPQSDEVVDPAPAPTTTSGPSAATLAPPGDSTPWLFSNVSTAGSTATAGGEFGSYAFSELPRGWSYGNGGAQLVDPGHTVEHPVTAGATVAAFASGVSSSTTSRIDLFTVPSGGWEGSTSPVATYTPPTGVVIVAHDVSGTALAVAVGPASNPGDVNGLYVFNEPPSGWSGTLVPSASLVVPEADSYYPQPVLNGDSLALGDSFDGATAVGGAGVIYDEPAGGWHGTIKPSAHLTGLSDAHASAWIFQEPTAGWHGTINASANLILPKGISVVTAVSGSTIAAASEVPTWNDPGGPCTDVVKVFSEPANGWSGVITGGTTATSTVDGECNGLDLSLDGSALFVTNEVVGEGLDTAVWIYRLTPPFPATVTAPGRPALTYPSLVGLRDGQPSLNLTANAGRYQSLESIRVTLPSGLSFSQDPATLRAETNICGISPESCTAGRGGHTLTVTIDQDPYGPTALKLQASQLALTESNGLVNELNKIARSDRKHHRDQVARLITTVTITDSTGATSTRHFTTAVR